MNRTGDGRMRRRTFFKVAAGSAAAAALPWAHLVRAAAAGAAAAGQADAGRRPNIVFILADDLGYADVGCYGQQRIKTPSIDRLAAEGMRFTDFYAGGCVCIPSRSCLMQGLHSGHTRHHGSNSHVPLEDSDLTVAEVLRDAGYTTACLGKWALGDDLQGPGAAHKQGWDYYFGEPNQTTVHSYYLPHMWEFDRDGSVSGLPPDKEMRKVPLPGNEGGGRKEYSHDKLAEKALAYLDARAAGLATASPLRAGPKPFFLYVPFTIPHADFEAPSDEPYSREDWPETERIYAAMITRMDAE